MTAPQTALLLVLIGSLTAARPQDLSTAGVRGILVEMDSGNLVAKASNLSRLHGEFRYATPAAGSKLDLGTMSKVEGSTLVIRVPSGAPTSATQFSLEVPKSMAVTIVGHSLSIRAEGFESPLTVRTFLEILMSSMRSDQPHSIPTQGTSSWTFAHSQRPISTFSPIRVA